MQTETVDSSTTPERQPVTTRRALLGAATAAVTLAAPGAATVAAGAPADPHPAWLAEWRALQRFFDTGASSHPSLHELPEWDRYLALEDAITSTAPRTTAGVLAQLDFVLALMDDGAAAGEREHEVLCSVRDCLAALAGRA